MSKYLLLPIVACLMMLGQLSGACTKKNEQTEETKIENAVLDGALDESQTETLEDPFSPLPETMRPRPPSLGRILRDECRLENPEDISEVILDQQMIHFYTRELISGLLDVYIDIQTTIEMVNSQEKSIFSIHLDILETRSIYFGDLFVNDESVLEQAASESELFMGTTTSFNASANDVPDEWSDIVCTVAFAERVTTTIGGHETEIRFDPPLPTGVSPTPIAERFDQELGGYRFFGDIVAEIVSTNNPRLSVGEKIHGSVFVEQIEASREVPGNEMSGDFAYRITNHFRDRQTTSDLGLLLWFEVYVDLATGEYKNFAADLGTDMQYLDRNGPTSMTSAQAGGE